jgi:hypothetical protein
VSGVSGEIGSRKPTIGSVEIVDVGVPEGAASDSIAADADAVRVNEYAGITRDE